MCAADESRAGDIYLTRQPEKEYITHLIVETAQYGCYTCFDNDPKDAPRTVVARGVRQLTATSLLCIVGVHERDQATVAIRRGQSHGAQPRCRPQCGVQGIVLGRADVVRRLRKQQQPVPEGSKLKGGEIGDFGGDWLEHPRRWLGAQWAGLLLGVPRCPEPPGAP